LCAERRVPASGRAPASDRRRKLSEQPVGARVPAFGACRRRLGPCRAGARRRRVLHGAARARQRARSSRRRAMTPHYESVQQAALPQPDELVLKHGELVKRIAYHVVSRLPSHIEVDDLIQAGMIGLLNAAQNYSPTKGANFETYAGIRIRGAMLDEARRSNWTPRSTFRNAKQVSQAIRSIENRTGRDARAQEIAEALGVSLEE